MKKTLLMATAALTFGVISCEENTESNENQATKDTEETVVTDTISEDTVVDETLAFPTGWELTDNPGITYLGVTDSVHKDEFAGLSDKYATNFGIVMGYAVPNEAQITGAPISEWLTWNPEGHSLFTCGIPVAEGTVGSDQVQLMSIPAGKALKYTHMGSYDAMQEPHMIINEFMESNGIAATGGPWEVYVTDPASEPDTTKRVSEIWYPVAM